MKKKIVSVIICMCMIASLFVGCGSNTNENKNNGLTENDTTAEQPAKGRVYYLNFKPEQAEAWLDLADDYREETGVEVVVQTAASGTYEQSLKSEMAKSEPPTLFQVNGPVGLEAWKKYCYDLKNTEIYKQVKSDDYVLKDGDAVDGIAYAIESYGIIYNKTLLNEYCQTDGALIRSADDINSFEKLKAVADDIQAKKDELGILGAFASSGMDSSSDWRFNSHLANLPIYYEYKDRGIDATDRIQGTYLKQYKDIWDLYITDSTCAPGMISSKTGEDAASEFAMGEAVFYQNGTWAFDDITSEGLTDEELGMLPIYIGVSGEENQGVCTGSENFWCVNKNASEEDIRATLDFLKWCITSDKGQDAMTDEMGFVTPFKNFNDYRESDNPLVAEAAKYEKAGKEAVSWSFLSIPSLAWKNQVGAALTEYAHGTGDWTAVEDAFVNGWATEYEKSKNE